MLAELAIEMPPPSVEIRDRETSLFLADLKLFAAAEADLDPAREPVGFEVSFGRAGDPDDEPLAQADPVAIDLGKGLTLRIAGRIDRIDRVGEATFEIVDYKTGGYWADDWKGVFGGGRRLQHALYGLAATALLKRREKQARVTAAEYYFTSARGQQERKRIPAPSPASVASVLADLRTVIASGLFIHAADASACRWCDFGHACGKDAARQAEAKHADASLAAYLKLVSHE
jgi:ATP-dependent helicase/nuclease subunit B